MSKQLACALQSRVDFANVCKHGLVNLFPLLEVFLTRIPFLSLHFQVGGPHPMLLWAPPL